MVLTPSTIPRSNSKTTCSKDANHDGASRAKLYDERENESRSTTPSHHSYYQARPIIHHEIFRPFYVSPPAIHLSILVILLWLRQPRTLARLLPGLNLSPCALTLRLQLIITRAQLCDSLLSEQLLQRPLLDVLILVLLELGDELDGALEDRALVLLAAGDNLGELVDAFVDGLASSALDYGSC